MIILIANLPAAVGQWKRKTLSDTADYIDYFLRAERDTVLNRRKLACDIDIFYDQVVIIQIEFRFN